jgi:DtxR family Mn-dependent transcriptional regulator
MHTFTEENYLKTLFLLSREDGETTVNALSKHLGIKMPTVNSMLKKLKAKKLLVYENYKPVRLTDKGRKAAALIIRKHRLTEMFLVDKMGFGWEQVHSIAEQIEHIQSPEFFEKMDMLLGYPKFDPHGSPIPDREGKIAGVQFFKLSDCHPGEQVVISAVANSSEDFLRFLNARGLKLGLILKITSIEPFDGTMQVKYGRTTEFLSQRVTERLLVARKK